MWKRLITAGVLIAMGVGVLVLREVFPPSFDIVVCAAMLLALCEVSRAMGESYPKMLRVLLLATALATLPLAVFMPQLSYIFVLLACSLLFALILTLFCRDISAAALGMHAFMLFYPAFLISMFYLMNDRADALFLLTASIAVASFSDAFAFFVGSLVGGPKLAPAVSPKKTISGAAGGVFGGVFGMLAVYYVVREFFMAELSYELWQLLIAGVLGAVFTILGDLSASSLKRKLGVKDFGNLLPGHGGLMDRVDSMLFNGFFVYVYFAVLLG